MGKAEEVTILGIILNLILFAAKLFAGLMSGSLAILSDASNSLMDALASVGIFLAVKISRKRADHAYPFGHHRAEPIAGLLVAIFAGMLAYEVVSTGVMGLINPTRYEITTTTVAILVGVLAVKGFMSYYFIRTGNRINSPAIRASGVDSRNDVFVTSAVLISVAAVYFGFRFVDSVAAILVGLFIAYSGYSIGKENVGFLMGHSPPDSYIRSLKALAKQVEGVKGINMVRAHYVGNFVQVHIHIDVDGEISTHKSHDISKEVSTRLEKLTYVDRAFVHIDPV